MQSLPFLHFLPGHSTSAVPDQHYNIVLQCSASKAFPSPSPLSPVSPQLFILHLGGLTPSYNASELVSLAFCLAVLDFRALTHPACRLLVNG